MKKIIFCFIFYFGAISFIKACDICGCGVGNTYIGILPEFKKYIVGVRYRYNALKTHVGVGGATTYLTTNESYSTAELWGGFYLSKKVRLLLSVPYSFIQRENQGNHSYKNGVSDINSTVFYEVLNKQTFFKNKILFNSLWIGGGLKLPTGKYSSMNDTFVNENNLFQLGTGSTDVAFQAIYDVRLQNIGFNMNALYKINTSNSSLYRYGNKLTLSGQLYYKFSVKNKFSFVPNMGILYEKSQSDDNRGNPVNISGGQLTLFSTGIEASYQKIATGINWQIPIQQNLAHGIIQSQDRVLVHVSLLF
ncbi:MAG: transporter [Alphaproteobacteria bacterium]|nr:transporter [Alphaproteobacteria bacterium]